MTNGSISTRNVHSIIPAVNILETPEAYIVTLDIPGALKEKISAAIENDLLLVTADVAEYSAGDRTESARQYRREFTLANDIDAQSIDAQYEAGVLTITLNKKKQYLPKQITIN